MSLPRVEPRAGESPSRFSRLAICGACLVAMGLLLFVTGVGLFAAVFVVCVDFLIIRTASRITSRAWRAADLMTVRVPFVRSPASRRPMNIQRSRLVPARRQSLSVRMTGRVRDRPVRLLVHVFEARERVGHDRAVEVARERIGFGAMARLSVKWNAMYGASSKSRYTSSRLRIRAATGPQQLLTGGQIVGRPDRRGSGGRLACPLFYESHVAAQLSVELISSGEATAF